MKSRQMASPDPNRLNVLMVGTQLTHGGAGRIGELLAGELQRQGHRVHAFVRDNRVDNPICRQVRHWRFTPLRRWFARHGLTDLADVATFLWRCREEYACADVIHLHNLHGDYLSLLALPLLGFDKPIVWMLHDAWPVTGNCAYPRECDRWLRSCGQCPSLGLYPQHELDRSRFYRNLKPKLFRAMQPRLLPSSTWLGDMVAGLPELARFPRAVTPNPVEMDLFTPPVDASAVRQDLGLRPACRTAVVIGDLYSDPRKNAPDAVYALHKAATTVPDLQLLAVGSSSRRLLAESGLAGRAIPHVHDRAELARAYGCGDFCVFPSQADNYPMTVIEAMACGTPVVAYALGGMTDQIRHMQTGLLAPGGDRDTFAANVTLLARNQHLAAKLGAAAREFVGEVCALPVVARRLRDEYVHALRAWQRRRRRISPAWHRGPLSRGLARLLDWEHGGVLENTSDLKPHSSRRARGSRGERVEPQPVARGTPRFTAD